MPYFDPENRKHLVDRRINMHNSTEASQKITIFMSFVAKKLLWRWLYDSLTNRSPLYMMHPDSNIAATVLSVIQKRL